MGISNTETKRCAGKKFQVTILMEPELLKRLDAIAKAEYRTRTGQILKIIKEGLK